MNARDINRQSVAFYRANAGGLLKRLQNMHFTQWANVAGKAAWIAKATETPAFQMVTTSAHYTIDGAVCVKDAANPMWFLSYAIVGTGKSTTLGGTNTKVNLQMKLTYKIGNNTYTKAATNDCWTLTTAPATTIDTLKYRRCNLYLNAAGTASIAWGPQGDTASAATTPTYDTTTLFKVATLYLYNGAAGTYTAGTTSLLTALIVRGYEGTHSLYVPNGYFRRAYFCLDSAGAASVEFAETSGLTAALAPYPTTPVDKCVVAEYLLNHGIGAGFYGGETDVDAGTVAATITPVMFPRGQDWTDID